MCQNTPDSSCADPAPRATACSRRVDDSVWLIIVGVALLAASRVVPTLAPLAALPLLYALIGAIYSVITSVNDVRNVKGRKPWGERPGLKPIELLAIGGALGTLANWPMLLVFYFQIVGPQLGADVSLAALWRDLGIALTAPSIVGPLPLAGTLHVPFAFLWVGALSVGATWCALALGGHHLTYLTLIAPLVLCADLAAAWVFFGELAAWHDLLVGLLVAALVLLTAILTTGDADEVTPGGGHGGRSPAAWWPFLLIVGRVAGVVAADVLIRGVVVEPDRRALILLPFRALYFTPYLAVALVWFAWHPWRATERAPSRTPDDVARGVRLAFVTVLLFVMGDYLADVAKGTSLSAGKLIEAGVKVALLPLAGAAYRVAGGARSLRGRSAAVFHERGKPALICTLALLATLAVWIVLHLR